MIGDYLSRVLLVILLNTYYGALLILTYIYPTYSLIKASTNRTIPLIINKMIIVDVQPMREPGLGKSIMPFFSSTDNWSYSNSIMTFYHQIFPVYAPFAPRDILYLYHWEDMRIHN